MRSRPVIQSHLAAFQIFVRKYVFLFTTEKAMDYLHLHFFQQASHFFSTGINNSKLNGLPCFHQFSTGTNRLFPQFCAEMRSFPGTMNGPLYPMWKSHQVSTFHHWFSTIRKLRQRKGFFHLLTVSTGPMMMINKIKYK